MIKLKSIFQLPYKQISEFQLQALDNQCYTQGGSYSDLPASLPPRVVLDLTTMAYHNMEDIPNFQTTVRYNLVHLWLFAYNF